MPTNKGSRKSRKSRNSRKKVTRTARDRAMIRKKRRMHRSVREKYGKPDCPHGKIVREGYRAVRNSKKIEVPPGCIKDVGRKGKGKQLFVLDKDVLGKYGYGDVKYTKAETRRRALRRAVKKLREPKPIFRRLIALSTLNKNSNPELSKRFKRDAYWIRETFGLGRLPNRK